TIKRKMIVVIMFTTISALVLTVTIFLLYDLASVRRSILRNLETIGYIIAANSSQPLGLQSPEAASQVLSSLKANPHVLAAAIFDAKGSLYAQYPTERPSGSFPRKPGPVGHEFQNGQLILF